MIINTERRIHFIGIGGIGMYGIAEVLITLGFKVSGSDVQESNNTLKLKKMGATVHIGHREENLESDIVVYSSAINEKNPEIIKARRLGLPILRRAEILADIMRLKVSIAVAGAHGKTTTTSMLATIFYENLKDPSYIIGGIVKNLDGHAYLGKGEYLIAEADESDGSFLLLNPQISVITNIDDDHLDHYKKSENIDIAFKSFCERIPFYGCACGNADDPRIMNLFQELKRPMVTYGIESDCDYKAIDIHYGEITTFSIILKNNPDKFKVELHMKGKHNVYNALGAIAAAHQAGLDINDITKALSRFSGVGRRAQKIFDRGNCQVFDDYGHHPTEIKATIEAFKLSYPNKKISLIFEPHRYTRTQNSWSSFLTCFNGVSELFLFPIYAASEEPIEGITSENLAAMLNKNGVVSKVIVDSQLPEALIKITESSDILLVMGAGKLGYTVLGILNELS